MNNDLIARYIYAVTRHLPQKTREDVEKELDSLISDMLAQRCGDVIPTDKDIRVVLIELGDPEEMAAKYSGDENKALISGVYYLIYKRILRFILPIAAAAIAFVSVLSSLSVWTSNPNPFVLIGTVIGQAISGAIGGAFQAFAVITVIFAILDRKKVRFKEGDMFSRLPPVPKKSARIRPHEPIIGIMWSILAVVFFLGFSQFAGVMFNGTVWIPVFDVFIIRSFWLPIVLWAVLGIAKEIVKLLEGQYTKRLAIVMLVVNILILACAAVIFLNNSILNPDLINHIGGLVAGRDGATVSELLKNFGLFFFGIICFVLILDTAVAAARAWRYGKG